jgi:hypothetical protein
MLCNGSCPPAERKGNRPAGGGGGGEMRRWPRSVYEKRRVREKSDGKKNAVEYLEQRRLLARSTPYDGPCFVLVDCPLNIREYRSCVVGVTESVNICFRDMDDGG